MEEIVKTDAYKKGYGYCMNKLSFRDKWPGKKDKDIKANILDLKTVQ